MTRRIPILALLAAAAFAGDVKPPVLTPVEEAGLRQLLTVKRVFIDHLTGGETAAQMREILMSSLQASKLFVLTENQERADAILKGGAEDLVFSDSHGSSEGVNARMNAGTGRQGTNS